MLHPVYDLQGSVQHPYLLLDSFLASTLFGWFPAQATAVDLSAPCGRGYLGLKQSGLDSYKSPCRILRPLVLQGLYERLVHCE
jgi:hypothetical protein